MGKILWTKETIEKAIREFINTNDREPQNDDYLKNPLLPHPRILQRRFSGLKGIRADLGLNTVNFTQGEPRRRSAAKAQADSRRMEAIIFNALYEKYDTDLDHANIVQVSRQFLYQQYIPEANFYANTSVDIAISFRNKKHVIMIDLFHPASPQSLQGCVNVKKAKTEKYPVQLASGVTHELLFVCTNEDISQEQIDRYVKKHDMYRVISYATFKRDILD